MTSSIITTRGIRAPRIKQTGGAASAHFPAPPVITVADPPPITYTVLRLVNTIDASIGVDALCGKCHDTLTTEEDWSRTARGEWVHLLATI